MNESEMIEKLWRLVPEATSAPNYFAIDEEETFEGYCGSCAEMKLAEVMVDQFLEFINGERTEPPSSESVYILSMGGEWPEEDGCKHCERCGVLLGYSLTNYGVRVELEHFESKRFCKPIDADDAFHIVAILEQTRWSDDQNVRKRGIRLGARAMRWIDRNQLHGPA